MKKNILILFTLLYSNLLFGKEDIYSFIGIQTSVSKFDKITAPTIGISYGEQSKDKRTTISYNYSNRDSNSFQTLLMQIDSSIFTKDFKNIPFKPYLGVAFGLMQNNRDRGYLYGIDTGLSYVFNDSIDFDLGYKFLKTAKMKDLDNINDLSLTMHYFY